LITLLSSKIKHFYMNRNYFNDAKTHIEPYFLNEWFHMSDFLVYREDIIILFRFIYQI
jgi:hypothetical protein